MRYEGNADDAKSAALTARLSLDQRSRNVPAIARGRNRFITFADNYESEPSADVSGNCLARPDERRKKKGIKKKMKEGAEGFAAKAKATSDNAVRDAVSFAFCSSVCVGAHRPTASPFSLFARSVRTQGDLDRTDAMAQNGSAGIINHRP